MRGPSSPAAKRAVSLYRDAPRGDRFHVRGRWWSCPFDAIERAVPLDGRVLEVGCGHGLLSAYLALSSPAREVLGVDIDEHKIELARAAAANLAPDEAQLSFARVEPGEFAEGRWDTIVVADVLYLLAPDDKRALLQAMVDHLAEGGSIVVKETDVLPRWKFAINRAQEYTATRILRITQGATLDFEPARSLASALEAMGLDARVERVDRGYPHPHALVVATQGPAVTDDVPTLAEDATSWSARAPRSHRAS